MEDYTPFSELNVTTMTSKVSLFGIINTANFYRFFPIDSDIRCVSFGPYIRGEKLNNKSKNKKISEKYLKNHASVFLVNSKINIKVSKNHITLVGCKRDEDILPITNMIIEKLYKVNEYIKTISSFIFYIINNCENIMNDCRGFITKNPTNFEDDYYIKNNWIPTIEMNEDLKVALMYISTCPVYISEFRNILISLFNNSLLITDDILKLSEPDTFMKNKKFILGYSIILQNLYNTIIKLPEEYNYKPNIYIPQESHKIILKIPYLIYYEGKKRKVKCITFMIESSGIVTISGPNKPISLSEYNKFRKFCNIYRNDFELL